MRFQPHYGLMPCLLTLLSRGKHIGALKLWPHFALFAIDVCNDQGPSIPIIRILNVRTLHYLKRIRAPTPSTWRATTTATYLVTVWLSKEPSGSLSTTLKKKNQDGDQIRSTLSEVLFYEQPENRAIGKSRWIWFDESSYCLPELDPDELLIAIAGILSID